MDIPGHSRCVQVCFLFSTSITATRALDHVKDLHGSQHLQPLEGRKRSKKYSLGFKNVSDVVSRMDSICLNCPTCHVHDCAEDLGTAPGWNWGAAKRDAMQAELVLEVDLPSANVRWVEMIDSKKFSWLWTYISHSTYSHTCPYPFSVVEHKVVT